MIYFGFLFVIVMNQSAQEELFTAKVLKAFFFHGLYFSSQYTFSPQIITVIKASIFNKDYHFSILAITMACVHRED